MNTEEREEEIREATTEYIDFIGGTFEDETDEAICWNSFANGIHWADTHPSRDLIEKILDLAFDWDSLDWDGFVDAVREKLKKEENI